MSAITGTFVLAHADRTDPRRLQLADVIILAPQRTPAAANELASHALHDFVGCALIAVPLPAGRSLIRTRGTTEPLIVPSEAEAAAVLGYLSLVLNRSN